MITLITGVPGTCKTAHAVLWLHELVKSWEKNPDQARPVFVHGVRELIVPHEVAPDVENWPQWAPTGALIVIDECQQFFRPRASSVKPPPCVAEFETHRHRGLDFWLITQHPNLIDQNIRRLVTRHIHFRRTWAGREQLEWSEVGNPDNANSRQISARKRISLPKKAFPLYKSAEVHTKVPLSIPKVLYAFLFCLIAGVVVWYQMINRIHDKSTGNKPSSSSVSASSSSPGQPAPMRNQTATVERAAPAAASSPVDPYQPRIAGLPHTAPIYDQVRRPIEAPTPAACAVMRDDCRCFTRAGVRLPDVPRSICLSIVQNGVIDDGTAGAARTATQEPARLLQPAIVQRAVAGDA